MSIITLLGFAAAALTTGSFLPQAIKTIRTKDTHSISFFMYLLFSTGTLLWLLFGLFSNNIPIIVANAITLVFAVIILFYKIKFRKKDSTGLK
ncbi:MAG: SemiSWEET family sugar transporter [Bacteroidetes bacterium]|nr:SemiSWEET family sugar transporter [Bacteroidota bacterium]MBS1632023.1 SemiSWEET family sugar transporter [Bacteroidota bacterium]